MRKLRLFSSTKAAEDEDRSKRNPDGSSQDGCIRLIAAGLVAATILLTVLSEVVLHYG